MALVQFPASTAGSILMSANSVSKSANLQTLIHRRDKVLAVLHPPSAAHARIMEKAGCEALFVGTGGVVGAYTGLADVGTATMTECVTIGGWIADSVSIPVIMDGDTGHGGIMAVRRMVRECIRAGIAGIRIDDQPLEGKRKTQSAGVEVVPLDHAIARYRAAVDMKKRARSEFRRDGTVLRPRCLRRHAGGHDCAAAGLPRRGGRRLGTVRVAPFDRRNQSGPRRRQRAVFLHERGSSAVISISTSPGPRRNHRLVSRFHPPRHLGGAVGLHDRFPVRRREGLGRLCRGPPRSALSRTRSAGRWRRRRKAASSRDGYRIFNSDTHVGPDARILTGYLSEAEKDRLRGWEAYKSRGRSGHETYTQGAAALSSPARDGRTRRYAERVYGRVYGRKAEARAIAARRC